jgi:hypothetical protein
LTSAAATETCVPANRISRPMTWPFIVAECCC